MDPNDDHSRHWGGETPSNPLVNISLSGPARIYSELTAPLHEVSSSCKCQIQHASVSKHTKCDRPPLVRSTKRFSPSRSWKHWSPSFVEMKRCERKMKNASPSRDNSSRIPWWAHPLFPRIPSPKYRRRGILEMGNIPGNIPILLQERTKRVGSFFQV